MFDANSLFIKTTATGNNSNSKTKSSNIVVNHNSSAANAAVATTANTTTSQLSDRLREASRSLEGFLHKKIKLNDNVFAVVVGGGAMVNTPSAPVIPVAVAPQQSVLLSITNTKLSEESYKQSKRASQVL